MNLKQIVLSNIKEWGFRTKKNLGQNFLIDEKILDKEVEFANIENKKVIEIGPGFGFLTKKLANKAKKVIAIEKDTSLRPYLEKYLESCDNVEIIWDDVLKIDIPNHKIVSNIPYQISSPLTFKLLNNGNPAVICFQKEFAERMLAQAGTRKYSRLSATVGFLAKVRKLIAVPKGCFWPQPKVDSIVLEITPQRKPKNWGKIKTLIDKIFMYPNKKISKIKKITGIKFPDELKELRVRDLSPNLLVVAVNYLK
jgi:16S rRNA (adenine1518-N6/adenine1519-N6)-dimethyltransferase